MVLKILYHEQILIKHLDGLQKVRLSLIYELKSNILEQVLSRKLTKSGAQVRLIIYIYSERERLTLYHLPLENIALLFKNNTAPVTKNLF